MPIYAFECAACAHSFDRLQKLSDADPTTCPACGEDQVRRQLTAPSFRLAGSGWYETDFKKDGRRNLAEGSHTGEAKPDAKPADAKSGAAPAATADAKPAAKAEPAARPAPAASKPPAPKAD